MRLTPIVNSFAAGELSPRLMGRTDSPKYSSGCEKMENFMALPMVEPSAVVVHVILMK